MTGEADEALARKAAGGDRQAFEALVRRHKAALYGFARRYVGDADDAYDIVQESFVAAWRALGRFDPKRSFATWLKAIALNKCRDLARRARTRRLFLRALAVAPAEPVAAEQDRDADRRAERLDRAVAGLPARYKEPLLLTTVGGMSHKEAGRMLGVSAKSVEMRLYRGRRKLLELLGETEG